MSERPSDQGGMTSGDPLAGAPPSAPPHESGPPGLPPRPATPELPGSAPGSGQTGQPTPGYGPAGPPTPGYGPTSPPPPGAGGPPAWPAPGPVAGRYVLSGWWRRVGASIIDGLVVGIPAAIVLGLLGIGLFASGDSDAGLIAFIGALLLTGLIFVVIGILYAPVMMAKTNGKTVGRMATGIRVIRTNGQPMTFGTAMLREVVLKWLAFGVVANSFTFGIASLIDVLWPLWDEENRALHDFPVNTRTIVD